jgi:predicted nuclease of predicted toxin-antitoxin system
MRLLFDQNLSYKLCSLLADLFPESQQVRMLGLHEADDWVIWKYCEKLRFAIVTQDVDFVNLSLLHGHPPKVIWPRSGNQPTQVVAEILQDNAIILRSFLEDSERGFIELFR